ncbi:MAG: hypothetical protein J6T49_07195 [Bacteroidales bacterium]|nr:hypothetical protein [Bacteroidales bacterium]
MKKLQILLLAILLSAPVFAQIDPTVVVDREYEGKIDVDVRMPQTPITVADSLKKFDVSFDYSIFDRPFRDLYEFSPYQAASLGVVPPKAVPHFSARVASQYPLMPEVDLFGQLVPKKNPNVNFGMFVKYASEAGKIPAMDKYIKTLDARRLRMSAGAFFKYAWEKGELSLLGAYRTSYAKDKQEIVESLISLGMARDSVRHQVNAYEADFKIRSTNVKDHEFYYDVDASFVRSSKDLQYLSMYDPYDFSETALNIDAEFGSSFEEHRMYVDVRSQNNWYDQLGGYYMGIIEFTPIYRYTKGRFDGRFGIRFSNSFAGDNSTSIYPDVDAKFELAENKLWIRAVANGGRNIDNLGTHLEAAPWLMMGYDGSLPDADEVAADIFKMRYTTRPIDAKLSFEGIIGSRLGINVYGTYTSFKDRMLLYSDRFTTSVLPFVYPEFVDYAKLSAGVELTWTSKDLRVFTSVQGNKYNSESQLFMLPKIESLSQIEYNFKERLFLSTALVIQGVRESMFGQVPAYLDLSAKAEFKVNRFLSVYIKGGNLLNKENYIYAGIGSMPINGGGGICINF